MPDIKTGHCVLQYLPQTYILNQKLLISLFTTIRLNKKAQLSFYVVGPQIAFFSFRKDDMYRGPRTL